MMEALNRLETGAGLQPGVLIDEHEAAAILCMSVGTLRNWRYQGHGPKWKRIGAKLVRYDRSDIQRFIERGGDDESK